MVTDCVWHAAGAPDGHLCVECLEERLERPLLPADFPPLPLNDDDEHDSVRLRVRKGSGREVEALYALASNAIVDLGVDVAAAAEALRLDAGLLEVWVGGRRQNEEFLAEIESEMAAGR